jgi:hypothetical protein
MQQAFHGELTCSQILLVTANESAQMRIAFRNKPGHQADWYESC